MKTDGNNTRVVIHTSNGSCPKGYNREEGNFASKLNAKLFRKTTARRKKKHIFVDISEITLILIETKETINIESDYQKIELNL